eukprot:3279336-Pyramimonas_sp.AAC.1
MQLSRQFFTDVTCPCRGLLSRVLRVRGRVDCTGLDDCKWRAVSSGRLLVRSRVLSCELI